ncbi:glycosyltransferase [Aliikangiella coralliicola]|uniref:Glycosyltransferase family 1 protein n=1 Tax=Aliikangiella coralliicola TaxID=2592383 RepID=A0A545UHG1_9GAMM|nr:glycosyltransferase [Aliikangiella coralliicola]TQV88899.1 glycosyltransferase family 1 protein [Aliikangiella coralliicola]
MKDQSIILFSSDDWGWKTSKYQLSTRFAKNNKVLFVSSIGFRAPKATAGDMKRIWNKLASFFKGVKKVEENLYVLTPIVIPFARFPFKNGINKLLLKMQLGWAKFKLKFDTPYVFAFSENWLEYVRNIKRKKLIYYCVDEQAGFEGLDAERFISMDRQMNQLADVIFCSARSLYEKNKQNNSNTHYMPHGVNYKLFASTLDQSVQIADDMATMSKPVFLFFGHISYDWVDKDLVKFLAKERPEYSWVYVGRYSMDADEFAGYNNVHVMGERDFEQLPSYCKGADVGTIPFVYSDLTNNCNPLKLPEYFSAGLPVVSTNIPEVQKSYGEETFVASNNQEFLEACDQALAENDDSKRQQRSDSMQEQSWEHRVNNIYEIILAHR